MSCCTLARSTFAASLFAPRLTTLASLFFIAIIWPITVFADIPAVHQHAFENRPFTLVQQSLQQQIDDTNNPKLKTELQLSLAGLYFQYDRGDLLTPLTKEIEQALDTTQMIEHRILNHFYRAYSHFSLYEYEMAATVYQDGLELLAQHDITIENGKEYLTTVFELYQAANAAFLQDYSNAVQTISTLKARADERDWQFLSALSLYWLGGVNYELKNYEQAEVYFRQSKQAFPTASLHYQAMSQVREAQTMNIVGDRADAFALLNLATQQLDQLGDVASLAYVYLLQSYFHSKDLNHADALEWIAKSVSLREALGNKSEIANAYVHYSAILAENNKPLEALEYAEKAALLVAGTEDLAGQWDAFNNYAQLLNANEQYQLAFEFMSKSERALLAKARLDITEETARLINQFEFQQQSLNNQFLDEKNLLLEQQLQQEQSMLARQRQTITLLSIFVIAILALLILIFKLYRNNKKLAVKDPLTSLPNRRSILEDGERTFSMSKRYQQSLCVLMVDIDNFKAINDSYGHDTGDKALIFVASIFEAVLRTTDCVGRVGGEEFLIILPNCSEEQGLQLANRLFSELATKLKSSTLVLDTLTVSIGLALNSPNYDSFISLAKSADIALYNAKEQGRNQIQVYKEGMTHSESAE